MSLLSSVKLRLKFDDQDEDIQETIDSCKAELKLYGIIESKLSHDDKTVKAVSGDTWETISNTYGLTVEKLKSLNGNINSSDISADQMIYVDRVDRLILSAIKMYCMAEYSFDDKEAERFRKSYENLRDHLALSTEYKVVT